MNSVQIGIRGKPFVDFLENVLDLAKVNKQHYETLLSEKGIALYSQAFTHKTADAKLNYEYLEFLGDVTVNKCVAWYLSRRFPHLNCPEGIKVLTRLKSNIISKKSFALFAKQLDFWNYISANAEIKAKRMDKALEDVFEAFFGATEMLVDSEIHPGAGYYLCYRIIETILDKQHLTLKYNVLFDAKTRLKETFDFFGSQKLGVLKYESAEQITDTERSHLVKTFLVSNPQRAPILLGEGKASIKTDAEQQASEASLKTLSDMGFVKPLSDDYKMFCQ